MNSKYAQDEDQTDSTNSYVANECCAVVEPPCAVILHTTGSPKVVTQHKPIIG